MAKRGGRRTNIFRRMANASFFRRKPSVRGAAGGPMQIGNAAHRGLNVLVLLAIAAGVAAILFILIPQVLETKPDKSAPPPVHERK